MFNGSAIGKGLFEHEVNGYKGTVRNAHPASLLRTRTKNWPDRRRRNRLPPRPDTDQLRDRRPRSHRTEVGKRLQDAASPSTTTRTVYAYGHTTQLPVETKAISLDPTVKDTWGLPRHPHHIHAAPQRPQADEILRRTRRRTAQGRRCNVPLNGSNGRREVSRVPPARHVPNGRRNTIECRRQIQSGPRRKEPVDVDGSSLVTSGRGQPTMTIQALAFRAGENAAKFAKRNEI